MWKWKSDEEKLKTKSSTAYKNKRAESTQLADHLDITCGPQLRNTVLEEII
jgi:hypothetical protein